MKYAILIFSFFVLTSCVSNKTKKVNLFNDYFFELNEKEKQININATTKDSYFEYMKGKDIQIPLFKYIKNKDYDIYIGIPVNTSMIDILMSDYYKDMQLLGQKTDSTLFDFKRYQIKKKYISEYTTTIQDNLIYIIGVTESKTISDSLFNYKRISNRINHKK